jgi:hypothetical protein
LDDKLFGWAKGLGRKGLEWEGVTMAKGLDGKGFGWQGGWMDKGIWVATGLDGQRDWMARGVGCLTRAPSYTCTSPRNSPSAEQILTDTSWYARSWESKGSVVGSEGWKWYAAGSEQY